jgi:hypothetical protein
MNKTSRPGLRLLGLSALAAGVAASSAWVAPAKAASSWTLYVRRSEVRCMEHDKKVFAPLTELLKAMGYSWKGSASFYDVTAGKGGGPEISAKQVTLTIDGGAAISPQVLVVGGKTWVLVKPVAEAAGALFVATPDLGAAQIVFPKVKVSEKDLDRAARRAEKQAAPATLPSGTSGAVSTSASTSSGSGEAKASAADDKAAASDEDLEAINAKRKDPLQTENLVCNNTPLAGSKTPSEARGTATIKNVSDLPVKNIRFTVYGARAEGEALPDMETSQTLAVLKPGETATQEFFWYNVQNVTMTAKIKCEFDPLPEKQAPPKKAEETKGESKDASKESKDATKAATPKPTDK